MSDNKIIETDRILKSLLEQNLNIGNEVIDYSTYKYVIYARKSTTSEERQERSLGDQIAECAELAKRLNLNVVEIIEEPESARESGIRLKFDKMLSDVKAGKYQGIIAWHPDRLARNMKDAGAVIDLLDKLILKDLRFATFTFENSPMGKMLLGISFVLSKQYTDHLSESVKRGNTHSLAEGRWIGKPKHGYYLDPNKRLRPDGDNWILIKQAFKKRLADVALTDIVDYLNNNKYSKAPVPYQEHGPRTHFVMTVQTLSAIFKDPFYAGVAIYGDQAIQLEELYDFTPIVTEDEWLKLCPMNSAAPKSKVSRLYRSAKHFIEADLLRQMITCGYCNRSMSSGITTKKKKDGTKTYLYYYRCETPSCSFCGKSVRAKVITNFIYDFFDHFIFASEEAYALYCEDIKITSREQTELARAELNSLKRELTEKKKSYAHTKAVCAKQPDMARYFKNELEQYVQEIPLIEQQIEHHKTLLTQTVEVPVAYEQFLELSKELASAIRKYDDITLKDKYIREVFSNLTVKDKVVAEYSLKEPFASWVKEGKFLNGRGSRT